MVAVDPEIRIFLDAVAAHPAPDFATLKVDDLRAAAAAMLTQLNTDRPPLGEVSARDILLEGAIPLRARIYRPAAATGHLPCLVFYHGGGWVVGDLDTHDIFCRRLSAGAGCALVAVDYRLAPEHPYPAAADDAEGALWAVMKDAEMLGLNAASIAIGGDSGGATMAAVVAQAAAAAGEGLAGQLLICPATDLVADPVPAPGCSRQLFANGYLLSEDEINWYFAQYLPADTDRSSPRISPIRGRLQGLAPAVIVTAGFDPLRDEGLAYATALAQAGVGTTLLHFPTMIHGFNLIDAVSAEARRSVDRVAEALAGMFRRQI